MHAAAPQQTFPLGDVPYMMYGSHPASGMAAEPLGRACHTHVAFGRISATAYAAVSCTSAMWRRACGLCSHSPCLGRVLPPAPLTETSEWVVRSVGPREPSWRTARALCYPFPGPCRNHPARPRASFEILPSTSPSIHSASEQPTEAIFPHGARSSRG